jgi:hypothetical protein
MPVALRASINAMALGDFTKQIAQQALLTATAPPKEPRAVPAENAGSTILGQIAAMQKQLKDDEELVVTFQQGTERIRVMEIFLASPSVAVLIGPDAQHAPTRVVATVASLQLVCKTAKTAAGAKPARVGLITPKPKDSGA